MGLFDYEVKRSKDIEPYKVYCKKCGHSMVICKQEKALCEWCGHWVFKNEKAEFKYRMKERLLKK